jgi:hypothetical protein
MLDVITLTKDDLINKTINIYGITNTGKTTIIEEIMKILTPHIPAVVVICPTDKQQRTFSNESVPLVAAPFVHYHPSEDLLKKIHTRQEDATNYFIAINNFENMCKIIAKLGDPQINAGIMKMNAMRDRVINDIGRGPGAEQKASSVRAMHQTTIITYYKQIIKARRKDFLALTSLSDWEREAVNNIDFNPKLLLVLDDVTTDVEIFKKNPILKKLYYEGRHINITVLMSLHDDSVIAPAMRSNIHVSIFTDQKTATRYYGRPGVITDKDDRKLITSYIKTILTVSPHDKLIYFSKGNRFGSYTASKYEPFTFGSTVFNEYASKITKTKTGLGSVGAFSSLDLQF